MIRFCIIVNLTTSVDSDVCPGDTVVFTCVTDTGQLQWTVGSVKVPYYSSSEPAQVVTKSGIFDLQLINVTGMTLVSTATAYNVSLTDDGIDITCTDSFSNTDSFEMESIVLGQFSSNSKSSILHYMQHYYHLNLSMCHSRLPVRLISPSVG